METISKRHYRYSATLGVSPDLQISQGCSKRADASPQLRRRWTGASLEGNDGEPFFHEIRQMHKSETLGESFPAGDRKWEIQKFSTERFIVWVKTEPRLEARFILHADGLIAPSLKLDLMHTGCKLSFWSHKHKTRIALGARVKQHHHTCTAAQTRAQSSLSYCNMVSN